MYIVCADLEGVFVPEIWISVAEHTGIDELRLTTRDISDYDVLMKKRLNLLDQNGLTLTDIQAVIAGMEPLDGARSFLDWLRSKTQLIVLSDTYTEFAGPLMAKLGWPTLLCHNLTTDANNRIVGYNLRIKHAKQRAIEALNGLNYHTIGMGDSYNDIDMLKTAHSGILFRPPENVAQEFPQFPVTHTYEELKEILSSIMTN